MLKEMKYFFRHFYPFLIFAFIISIPLLIVSTIRTNKSITLKGDTEIFADLVELDTEYESKGSFSTIYVVSMDNSTILQNLVCGRMETAEISEISSYVSHLSSDENSKASKIMHDASVASSMIVAYTEAKKEFPEINLSYTFLGVDLTYYKKDSDFRVGDRIIGCTLKSQNNAYITIDTKDEFLKAINSKKQEGDTFLVKRGNKEITISWKKEDGISGYVMYDLKKEESNPSFTINKTNIGGPSGGLLQTLSVYNRLVPTDYTHGLKIAGTGTMSTSGKVGAIGGIREKIPTAYDDNMDIFFCPSENYEEALIAYNTLPNKEKMRLVRVETFYDALRYLKEEC